jgi:hypothetical protein
MCNRHRKNNPFAIAIMLKKLLYAKRNSSYEGFSRKITIEFDIVRLGSARDATRRTD